MDQLVGSDVGEGKGMKQKRVRFDMRVRERIIPGVQCPQEARRTANKHMKMGNHYYHQGRSMDALREYTHSIEASPDSACLYENRAACYWMLGDHVKCCDDSLEAIQFDFKCYRGHTWAGRTCLQLGRLKEARQYLTRAQELNPRKSRELLVSCFEMLWEAEDLLNTWTIYMHQYDFHRALQKAEALIELLPHAVDLKILVVKACQGRSRRQKGCGITA
jgi:tetratricopeptide (TPR) repeat protein